MCCLSYSQLICFEFLQTLTSLGILLMLEMTLMSEDVNIKQAAIDILTILVEFSPSVIREYILQQPTDTGRT